MVARDWKLQLREEEESVAVRALSDPSWKTRRGIWIYAADADDASGVKAYSPLPGNKPSNNNDRGAELCDGQHLPSSILLLQIRLDGPASKHQ